MRRSRMGKVSVLWQPVFVFRSVIAENLLSLDSSRVPFDMLAAGGSMVTSYSSICR
jgi:hypothetical protein